MARRTRATSPDTGDQVQPLTRTPQARIMKVDAEKAEYFLGFVKPAQRGVRGTNRRSSEVTINSYAGTMLEGKWPFTHQGIGFTGFLEEGDAVMVDGEQRCRALVQAATVGAKHNGKQYPPEPGVFIEVMVTEGLSQEAALAMDIGRGRTAADYLSMNGETNTLVLGATLNLVFAYHNIPYSTKAWRHPYMTPQQRQDFLDDNPLLREAVLEGARLGRFMTVSSAAAGWFLAREAGEPKDIVNDFMDLLYTGEGLTGPLLLLRELLINARNKKRRLTRGEQLALFIKVYKKWRAGEQIALLAFRKDENFPRF